MDKISIRQATRDDLEVLRHFEQELIKAERPMDPCIRQGKITYHDLENMIGSPEVALLVAVYQGRVVGSGFARPMPARHYLDHEYYANIGFMYTVPEMRGKGVNRQIVEALRNWCEAQGLHELRLTVYHTNTPAIKAYEKAGFKSHIIEMRLRTGEA